MTNDEAIRILPDMKGAGDDWDKAIDLAVETLKVQLSKEDATSDCISRHAAIDALMAILDKPKHAEFLYTDEICKVLNELPSVQSEPCDDAVSREAVLDEIYDSIKKCEKALASGVFNEKERFGIECEMKSLRYSLDVFENLPSVQPEERTEKHTETHACDCVDRQAAIDILDAYQVMVENGEEKPYAWARLRMSDLPSVQTEIIHCKDCKHKGTKNCVANVWAAILGVTVKDDFYCGLAERRTDERTD